MAKCRRCGLCCHIIIDGKSGPRCKYLIKQGKITACRIYKNRLGVDIGHGAVCKLRIESPYDYENCPFNTNKPVIKEVSV